MRTEATLTFAVQLACTVDSTTASSTIAAQGLGKSRASFKRQSMYALAHETGLSCACCVVNRMWSMLHVYRMH